MSQNKESQSTDEQYLCVTCGKMKTKEAFEVGDCTCEDCNAAGDGSVRYDLVDGEVVEVQ